jgi:hypothetical protein
MDKEEALIEFLKGLRISLNNASVYFKEHPFYIKSVQEFKQKINDLLVFLNPIRVNVAAHSLFIDGKNYDKTQLHTELASLFHLRKIKSIEIREGLTVDELLNFLSALALPPKDIMKNGGLRNILNRQKNAHCLVEDLDYSQLLGMSGEEAKDVWGYLFGEAAQSRDERSIDNCVDNFGTVVGNLKAKDLTADDDLKKNICSFFVCLKDGKKDKFDKCSKEMFRAVMKNKDSIGSQDAEKIKEFFKDVNEEQFADMFLEGVVKDDSFDALSLQLFSKLTGGRNLQDISRNLLDKISAKDPLKDEPRAAKRVKDLLSASQDQAVSEVYRNILSSLLRGITFEKGVFFDRSRLHSNFRYLLLNLLEEEKERDKLSLVVAKVAEEWGNIVNDKDTRFLRFFCDIERSIKARDPGSAGLFEDIDKRLTDFVEHLLWEDNILPELGYLIDIVGKSSLDADYYLNKIFSEERLSPSVLKLFFKSFPDQQGSFLKRLEKRSSDMDFVIKVINNLKLIEPRLALSVLTGIYALSGEITRIEILKVMHALPEISVPFLLSVLQKDNAYLKRHALAVLSRDPGLRKEACEALLAIPSALGMKNALLLENMGLIDEAGFKEAGDYLQFLKGRPYFWNRKIRQKAGEILDKFNARKG